MPIRIGHNECIECGRERFWDGSRYCRSCHHKIETLTTRDRAEGRNRDENYGYSVRGMNEGLNVYIWDRAHFRKVTDFLWKKEGIRHKENVE